MKPQENAMPWMHPSNIDPRNHCLCRGIAGKEQA